MSNDSVDKRAAKRVGTMLRDKYRLERVLGVGGMAAVYLATHRNGHRVAVKMLHPEVSADDDLRARFVREGYTANAIDHDGVVRVIDDDVADDGAAYLVMELLEGETLQKRFAMSGGKLPVREVVALACQLLAVLSVAHEKGVVHRDIKPDNLFLTHAGVLKVLDFGIARAGIASGGTPTKTGRAMGTPSFMPPEQALGRAKDVDARADLWAVGATMFLLASGRHVHDGETPEEQLVYTATRPAPAIASVCSDVPLTIAEVIDKALRFERSDRWQDARAMKDALEQAYAKVFGGNVAAIVISTRARIESAQTLDAAATPAPSSRNGREIAETKAAIAQNLVSPETLGPTQRSARESTAPSPDGAPRSHTLASPGAPRAAARTWAMSIGAAVVVSMSAIAFLATRAPKRTDPGSAPSAASSVAAGECASSVSCIASHSGTPHRCVAGECKPLLAEGCQLLAEPGDIANDATIWIGAMYHDAGGFPVDRMKSVRAVDLARRDFGGIAGGLPPVRAGAPKRPIAVVACEDKDASRVAHHLVDDVGVPAILGFARSQEVMDLATTLFAERDVAAFASNQAAMLSTLPHAEDKPRLVWRVTPSAAAFASALVAVVRDVWEPELRGPSSGVPKSEPLRVAVTAVGNTTGTSYADLMISGLRYNGKSVAENGKDFRLIRPTSDDASETFGLDELLAFQPHVVVATSQTSMIAALEARWPKSLGFRPRYVTIGALDNAEYRDLVRASPDIRKRLVGVDTAVRTQALAKFVLHYDERFTPPITPFDATSAPYDAFYLLAYAIASLGDAPITGSSISRAIARFRPPGVTLDVGPSGVFAAFDALAKGQNVDLVGTTTSLDFDLETGDAPATFSAFCLAPGPHGAPPEPTASDLGWDPQKLAFVGARPCP